MIIVINSILSNSIFQIFIGAILSYIIYAFIQVNLLKKYALYKYNSKDIKYNVFDTDISLYENNLNDILIILEDLKIKYYLICGINNKVISNQISNVTDNLWKLIIIKSWAEKEAYNIFNVSWNGKAIENINLYRQNINNISKYEIIDKIYINNKKIEIKDDVLLKKFQIYLNEHNIDKYDNFIKLS